MSTEIFSLKVLTSEIAAGALMGGFPLVKRGASGVLCIDPDAVLLFWILLVFCSTASGLGVSEMPNICDLVLPPILALCDLPRRPLGGLW